MDNEKIIILKENGEPDKKAMAWSKFKSIMSDVGKKTKEVASNTWTFVCDNKENLAFIVPIAVTAMGGIAKLKNSSKSVNTGSYRENNTYYDRSDNSYWELKRKMSNREMAEFSRRRRAGENPEDILEDMRILK